MGIRVTAAVAALLLSACAAPPQRQAATAVTNSGIERVTPNMVLQTFAANVADVRTAVLKSLLRMDVKVTADRKTNQGWKITAMSEQRTIDIQLETLNATTTRMRIIVGGSAGWEEKSTEIVLRTIDALAPKSQIRAA
jgi:Protein of unknown function (DUF3568)